MLLHKDLANAESIRFQTLGPGKLAHICIPHGQKNLDLVTVYQYVWRTRDATSGNLEVRKSLSYKLDNLLRSLPSGNQFVVAEMSVLLSAVAEELGPQYARNSNQMLADCNVQ